MSIFCIFDRPSQGKSYRIELKCSQKKYLKLLRHPIQFDTYINHCISTGYHNGLSCYKRSAPNENTSNVSTKSVVT